MRRFACKTLYGHSIALRCITGYCKEALHHPIEMGGEFFITLFIIHGNPFARHCRACKALQGIPKHCKALRDMQGITMHCKEILHNLNEILRGFFGIICNLMESQGIARYARHCKAFSWDYNALQGITRTSFPMNVEGNS